MPSGGRADTLAIGFGTAVTMWTVGYFCRLFGDAVPAPLLFVLLLATLATGGFVAGRYSPRGLRGGAQAGLVAGLVNLLIIGSLIGGSTPHEIRAGAWLWVPGTIAVSVLLAALGAAAGRFRYRGGAPQPDWAGALAGVAAAATFLLLAAGGLVTGFDAGLAVVDWPNTEGYNMFLYPLARMTGGVYLEHAHRLLGSLVGLTTLVLALHVQLTARGGRIKAFAWLVLGAVVVQGILGGLRVTGRFTLSTDPAHTEPNILLAIGHGVFGQVIFAALVALAIWRSRAWSHAGPPLESPGVAADRLFGSLLIVLLVVQIALGGLVRHFTPALHVFPYGLERRPDELIALGQRMLMAHIAVFVPVVLLAVGAGVRAWGLYGAIPVLRRLGVALLWLVGLQFVLGLAAVIVTGQEAPGRRPAPLDVAVTTLHQIVGAALLAGAVALRLWVRRCLIAARPLDVAPTPPRDARTVGP